MGSRTTSSSRTTTGRVDDVDPSTSTSTSRATARLTTSRVRVAFAFARVDVDVDDDVDVDVAVDDDVDDDVDDARECECEWATRKTTGRARSRGAGLRRTGVRVGRDFERANGDDQHRRRPREGITTVRSGESRERSIATRGDVREREREERGRGAATFGVTVLRVVREKSVRGTGEDRTRWRKRELGEHWDGGEVEYVF